jgi:predicted transcriptional regulator
MMTEYLDELKEKGFITEMKTKQGRTYIITEKGINYINQYSLVVDFANSFGLDS